MTEPESLDTILNTPRATIVPGVYDALSARIAVRAGANVKALQRMLGHASAAITLDIYADLFDDDLDAVAARKLAHG